MHPDEPYLDFAALTLDSNILRGQRYNFDGGILKQLEQFNGSPVEIIQPDVIHFEGVTHLSYEISEALKGARSNLKALGRYVEVDGFTSSHLGPDVSPRELAEHKLNQFYKRINGRVIPSSEADVGTLMKMYFNSQPPFDTVKDKKHEFPDAVALLALENWAITNQKKMVLVSKDKGWRAFANNSPLLHVVEEVSDALSLFQPHTKVKELIALLQSEGLLEINSALFKSISDEIKERAVSQEPTIDAGSFFNFEYDDVQVEYVGHKFASHTADEKLRIAIVLIEEDRVVLSLNTLVTIKVTAQFAFTQYDSIDKDYVPLGGALEQRTASYEADVLLHFEGDWTDVPNHLLLGEIEIQGELEHVEFGDVGPDYSQEHEEQQRWEYEWDQEKDRRRTEDSKY